MESVFRGSFLNMCQMGATSVPGMVFGRRNGVLEGSWGKEGVHRVSWGDCSRDLWLIKGLLWRLWAVFEGQLGILLSSKSHFERDCVFLGNRRAF